MEYCQNPNCGMVAEHCDCGMYGLQFKSKATTVEIISPARCKHCINCYTIKRKTYCAVEMIGERNSTTIRTHAVPTTQMEKACPKFSLFL